MTVQKITTCVAATTGQMLKPQRPEPEAQSSKGSDHRQTELYQSLSVKCRLL
jgi:hypothetical protein